MKKFSLFVALIVSSLSGMTQGHSILGEFTIVEDRGKVWLNWSVRSGSTCNGIQIFRSTDSLNFEQIGEIPGVCGNINSEEPFEFTDAFPVKNKINYYRLELGNYGSSQILSIDVFDFTSSAFQIRPLPANDKISLIFSNYSNLKYDLNVFSIHNKKVLFQTTSTDSFNFNTGNFENGVYIFTISRPDNSEFISGKIIIKH